MAQARRSPRGRSLKKQWNLLSTAAGRAVAIVGGSSLLIGAFFGAYVFLTPQVEIRTGIIGSDTDASQVEFIVKNGGRFEVSKVAFNCKIVSPNGKFETEGNLITGLAARAPMDQFITNLTPGKEASRNCYAGVPIDYPAVYDVTATFDWPLWPTRLTSAQHFVSIRGNDGHMNAQPDLN